MQKPLVSILIPFKNTAQYLPECLESILKQNFNNWEVLAIDDHSTDESRVIANSFAHEDSRIRVFSNDGNGIIKALRLAYSQSKGKLITRMDSDDIMTPNKIKVLVKALQGHGQGHIAIGQVRYFSDQGIRDGYARYEQWLNHLTKKGINFSEIYKECVIPSPCWMVYHEDLDACGAFGSDRYPEDYDLAFRFYERALTCVPCSEVLHLWRDYDNRTSRTSVLYAENHFLDIKLHYFLKLHHNVHRPIAIWGAGSKGKIIAQSLLDKKIPFHWLCDNPNKIGKKIYGKEMLHYTHLKVLKNPQSIISVANKGAQTMIHDYFSTLGQLAMKDYFMFC